MRATWQGVQDSFTTCIKMSLSKLAVKWSTPPTGEEPHHPPISFNYISLTGNWSEDDNKMFISVKMVFQIALAELQ